MFEKHHNKWLDSVNMTVLDKLQVRSGVQCQQKCQEYEGQCTALNLAYSRLTQNFVCELLQQVTQELDENHLKTDNNNVFMIMLGDCLL